jgi:uncharacterized protein
MKSMLDYDLDPRQWPADHRPWQLPYGEWLLFQQWEELLFAHWRVPAETLRGIVPTELEIDTFYDEAWIGVTPFRISGARAHYLPAVPGLSTFPELDVRTYVTRGGRPGVYYFSMDAGNPVAVSGGRQFFRLPYHTAELSVTHDGVYTRFRSHRTDAETAPAEFDAVFRGFDEVFRAEKGSLEYFLTERYCLYTVEDGRVHRVEVHHLPWPLQRAEADISLNTMTLPLGITLPDEKPLLHFSSALPTVIWAPEEVTE